MNKQMKRDWPVFDMLRALWNFCTKMGQASAAFQGYLRGAQLATVQPQTFCGGQPNASFIANLEFEF